MARITIQHSDGNSRTGERLYYPLIDGRRALVTARGVGRWFKSEAAARRAAEKHIAEGSK